MPTICSFYGILIQMYFGDHLPPHFHAKYGEYNASIQIENFAVTKGYLPPKALAMVMEWASLHQEELFIVWKNFAKDGSAEIIKIEPLK